MKSLASFVIGAPVTFLGLILFTGSVENAWMLLMFSVICTLGIGLLVWLPLCWAVGAAILAFVGPFINIPDRNAKVEKEDTGSPLRPQGTIEITLTMYIKKAVARGMSDDEIGRRLRRNGWTDAEIQKARSRRLRHKTPSCNNFF